jgi:trans-aconitate methyltransferase
MAQTDDPVDEVRRAYDRLAEAWQSVPRDFGSRRYVEQLVAGLPAGSRILDLGCGNGLPITRFLADRGFRVTGVDISPEQLRHARENVPEARFLLGDMRSVAIDDTFHAIVAWDAVFHVPRRDHAGLFLRFAQWLEPGGQVLLAVGATAGEFSAPMMGVDLFFAANTPQQERKALRDAGFELRLLEVDDPSSRGHVALLARWS